MSERIPMTRARHSDREMHLPEGKACVNCVHFRRCNFLFGHIETDEVCDWSPSRFVAIADAAKAETFGANFIEYQGARSELATTPTSTLKG